MPSIEVTPKGFDVHVYNMDWSVDWLIEKMKREIGAIVDDDEIESFFHDLDDQFVDVLRDNYNCFFDDWNWNGADEISFCCDDEDDADKLVETINKILPLENGEALRALACASDLEVSIDECDGEIYIIDTGSDSRITVAHIDSEDEYENGKDEDDDEEEQEEIENDFTFNIGTSPKQQSTAPKAPSYGEYVRNTDAYKQALKLGNWLAAELGVSCIDTLE